MAALVLKQLVDQWKNDRDTDTPDAFLHCFQLHWLVHVGLLRTGLNILAGLHYCFRYYHHYQKLHIWTPTGSLYFFLNKTTKIPEDCQYCSSLAYDTASQPPFKVSFLYRSMKAAPETLCIT